MPLFNELKRRRVFQVVAFYIVAAWVFLQVVDLAFESVSARKSRELGAIFSEVLAEAQAEGLALVIYERQQTVYHVTVARALADR